MKNFLLLILVFSLPWISQADTLNERAVKAIVSCKIWDATHGETLGLPFNELGTLATVDDINVRRNIPGGTFLLTSGSILYVSHDQTKILVGEDALNKISDAYLNTINKIFVSARFMKNLLKDSESLPEYQETCGGISDSMDEIFWLM